MIELYLKGTDSFDWIGIVRQGDSEKLAIKGLILKGVRLPAVASAEGGPGGRVDRVVDVVD